MAAVKARADGRRADQLRPVRITRRFLRYPEGSCLIELGETKVICAASLETGVPKWLEGGDRGWVTAEYAMLPRATHTRSPRESRTGRADGRALEIQRLVGRCLRGVTDLRALGERRIVVDCDVIQADGGTRAAAITGGYVALRDALVGTGVVDREGHPPLREAVAGVSAGFVDGVALVDLAYDEDSRADVDLTCAFTAAGLLVEVQGTGEGRAFAAAEVTTLLEAARPAAALLCRMVNQMFDRDMPAIWTREGS